MLVREKSVGVDELKIVRDLFDKNDFWKLPTNVDVSGLDGSHWILEALNNGYYHIVDRWSPEGGPTREMGERLLELADYTPDELY